MLSEPADSPLVLGPAYLDRVLRVDRPLLDPRLGRAPLDRSVDGVWQADGARPSGLIHLVDPGGAAITIEPPPGWPGPVGTVALSRRFVEGTAAGAGTTHPKVRGVAWLDDLGGMGAGFAASLGGTLVSALGPLTDPASQAVANLLEQAGIRHEPVRLADRAADWTLLISSGAHGDKLPVGLRGCHAAWTNFAPWSDRVCRVRVVTALPNLVVPAALGADHPRSLRAFFPNARNMLDRTNPLARFADRFNFLSCNRGEWDDLGDQTGALDQVALVAITDGARGAVVRFLDRAGDRAEVEVPAFPRVDPIRDTNRAGEAFAATLLATLVGAGWTSGPASAPLVRQAARRAAAAAALVLGRTDFGFPTAAAIDRAVERGVVG